MRLTRRGAAVAALALAIGLPATSPAQAEEFPATPTLTDVSVLTPLAGRLTLTPKSSSTDPNSIDP